jgi:hypothetical protein
MQFQYIFQKWLQGIFFVCVCDVNQDSSVDGVAPLSDGPYVVNNSVIILSNGAEILFL